MTRRRSCIPALSLALVAAVSLPLSSALPLAARQAPANSTQPPPALLCVANIATRATFTLSAPLTVDVVLAGGGGGGSAENGRGGGGGSTAIDFDSTHLFAPGGHGGYINGLAGSSWSGYAGAVASFTGVQLPAGAPITVTVGGGGGAGNPYCVTGGKDVGNALICYFGGGGGGAGAYGGGGGGASLGTSTDTSGGGGGEQAGSGRAGNAGGAAAAGSQYDGGDGEQAGTICGGAGGQGASGSQAACQAGNGGGYGSGGGSPAQPLYNGASGGQSYMYGGIGGSSGSAGGPPRSEPSPSTPNYQEGSAQQGQGACSFAPTGSAVLPSGAGAGGVGGKEESFLGGGNAGYAVIVYVSPDGQSCPIPSQAQQTPEGLNYCVGADAPETDPGLPETVNTASTTRTETRTTATATTTAVARTTSASAAAATSTSSLPISTSSRPSGAGSRSAAGLLVGLLAATAALLVA